MKNNKNNSEPYNFLDLILDSTRINNMSIGYLVSHPMILSFVFVEFIFEMIGAIFGIAFDNVIIGILIGLIVGFPISICVGLKVKKEAKKKSK